MGSSKSEAGARCINVIILDKYNAQPEFTLSRFGAWLQEAGLKWLSPDAVLVSGSKRWLCDLSPYNNCRRVKPLFTEGDPRLPIAAPTGWEEWTTRKYTYTVRDRHAGWVIPFSSEEEDAAMYGPDK
jgi:hypothetical protein